MNVPAGVKDVCAGLDSNPVFFIDIGQGHQCGKTAAGDFYNFAGSFDHGESPIFDTTQGQTLGTSKLNSDPLETA